MNRFKNSEGGEVANELVGLAHIMWVDGHDDWIVENDVSDGIYILRVFFPNYRGVSYRLENIDGALAYYEIATLVGDVDDWDIDQSENVLRWRAPYECVQYATQVSELPEAWCSYAWLRDHPGPDGTDHPGPDGTGHPVPEPERKLHMRVQMRYMFGDTYRLTLDDTMTVQDTYVTLDSATCKWTMSTIKLYHNVPGYVVETSANSEDTVWEVYEL